MGCDYEVVEPDDGDDEDFEIHRTPEQDPSPLSLGVVRVRDSGGIPGGI